jgi:hypothetical protein
MKAIEVVAALLVVAATGSHAYNHVPAPSSPATPESPMVEREVRKIDTEAGEADPSPRSDSTHRDGGA